LAILLCILAPLLQLGRGALIGAPLVSNVILNEVTTLIAQVFNLLLNTLQPLGRCISVLKRFKLVALLVDLRAKRNGSGMRNSLRTPLPVQLFKVLAD